MRISVAIGTLVLAAAARDAAADGLVTTDSFAFRPGGRLAVDGGLVVGKPAALGTGMLVGLGAGVEYSQCRRWAIGARVSWGSASASSTSWTVTDDDVRLRVTGAVQHVAGRGTVGLRLGVGGTLVHEDRVRNQGERAGLTGSDLETTALAMLPAADLEAVVALHIAGAWQLSLSGGPSLLVRDGDAHGGWTSQLGVSWQP